MREKFKKLADTLRKRPSDSCSALKKIPCPERPKGVEGFPEGLKLKWLGDKWEICGVMLIGDKGGTDEVKLEMK